MTPLKEPSKWRFVPALLYMFWYGITFGVIFWVMKSTTQEIALAVMAGAVIGMQSTKISQLEDDINELRKRVNDI